MINETVPEGFQKTEVGIIPNDWKVISIKAIGNIKTGPFGTLLKANEYSQNEGTPLISVGEIGEGTLRINKHTPLIPKSVVKRLPEYILKYGDIVFGRKGGVERSALVEKHQEGYFLGSDGIRIRFPNSINPHFVSYQFQRKSIQIWLLQNATGTTMASMNQEILGRVSFPTPPTKDEQTAIANALNDADELLTRLEKLIAKKREIKQGAMQELLKPKDDWEVKKLGEIANIVGGGTPSTFNLTYWNGNINWFTPTEIGKTKYTFESVRKITKQGLDSCSGKLLPVGTILLTSRASIGDISILMNEACTNQGFQSLVPKSGINNEFVYYLMLTIKSLLIQNASGSTFLEISPNKIRQIEVSIPKSNTEQTRIAQILSDMDAEIEALEKKLEKYKMLKQGMMQNLLTGRIRLVKNAEARTQ